MVFVSPHRVLVPRAGRIAITGAGGFLGQLARAECEDAERGARGQRELVMSWRWRWCVCVFTGLMDSTPLEAIQWSGYHT